MVGHSFGWVSIFVGIVLYLVGLPTCFWKEPMTGEDKERFDKLESLVKKFKFKEARELL